MTWSNVTKISTRSDTALRKKATQRLKEGADVTDNLSSSELKKMLQELHIHQIELEMQNEELNKANEQLNDINEVLLYTHDL